MEPVYVLDTSALIFRSIPEGRKVTITEVYDELEGELSKLFFEKSSIKVLYSDEESIEKVRDAAKGTGDDMKLSETDVKLLALANQIKEEGKDVKIVSDDYSIQNVANKLNLEFEGIMQEEIGKEFRWIKKCVGCYREFNSDEYDMCPICGSGLQNRVIRQKDIIDD